MRDFKMKIVELSIGKNLVYKTIDIDVVDLVLKEYTNLKQPDSLYSVDGFSNGKIVNSAANVKGGIQAGGDGLSPENFGSAFTTDSGDFIDFLGDFGQGVGVPVVKNKLVNGIKKVVDIVDNMEEVEKVGDEISNVFSSNKEEGATIENSGSVIQDTVTRDVKLHSGTR